MVCSSKRLLLLVTASSYRTQAFADVARALGVELVYGVDMPKKLGEFYRVPLALDFADVECSTADIVAAAQKTPFYAILAVDDSGSLLAAQASVALGLAHNAPEAALAARNKYRMREMLKAGGVPVPYFERVEVDGDLRAIAHEIDYPVVVKPLLLSGSRGVIRANNAQEFVEAGEWLRDYLRGLGGIGEGLVILVEEYLPGGEVALEGLLTEDQFHVLALFDKPDPLIGPFFEETIYVTPSRLPDALQQAIAQRTKEAAVALGLRRGPVHAELRFNERGVWLIEMAGRSIGGLCGSILEFGTSVCLEELIVRQAVDLPLPDLTRAHHAAGVMMIPIPKAGVLRRVTGIEPAQQLPNVTGVEITAPLDYPLTPLPEGDSYLGFIFARANTPAQAEHALRAAHAMLDFQIEEQIRVFVGSGIRI
ncbi:MAG: ATP-grasp domain-containing protein [Ardenticatenaceae bacterium]